MHQRASIRVQTDDFDVGAELAALHGDDGAVGALVSFVGTVRDQSDGRQIGSMELEHYPGMTEKAIGAVVDAAADRFEVLGCRVVHRVGLLQPHDRIVLVAVSARHRGPAFAACEYVMDYLKTRAPFWKKEQTPEGARWVDARESDDAALRRWSDAAG